MFPTFVYILKIFDKDVASNDSESQHQVEETRGER
jgi:hypothetical protein